MTMRVRTVLTLIVGLAMMGLASCGHYTCGATFGSSSCTAGAPGLGGGGNGSATAAFVFVADAAGNGTTGTIDGYTLNTTASTFGATPSYLAPAIPLNDGGVGMAVAQKKYLYTGFGLTNQIFGWSIGTDGSLTAVGGSPYAAPFMSSVSAGFGAQNIVTNPAGTLLFFSATFSDEIFVYQIGSSGVLTAVTGSPFSVAPLLPGNMTTDGLGKYLYFTDSTGNHTGSEIGAYNIGTGSNLGVLTAVPGSPFSGTNFDMWQVQGDSSGKFLVGTKGLSVPVNGGPDDDNLYVFSIAQSGLSPGAITQVGSVSTGSNVPLDIAVQSNTNGNLVYSFGIADSALAFNAAEGYALNSSGTLTAVVGSPFSNAEVGDLGQFDQSGAFLFIYGGIFNINTNTTTFQMGAFDVASNGDLTQPTSTLTLPAGGFWVATDAP
jgi:hypothetical protein